MNVKVRGLFLGAVFPAVALCVGVSLLHRSSSEKKLASLPEEAVPDNLLLAVAPDELLADASPPSAQPTPPSDRWRMFDPNSMEKDHHLWLNTEVLFFQ